MKDILMQNGAKEILPPTAPEVKRIMAIVQRLLPAAQEYCDSIEKEAKRVFQETYGESFEAAQLNEAYQPDKQAMMEMITTHSNSSLAVQGVWKVVVLDSELNNAFVSETFPGRVFVCRGLLETVKPTDEELALVLAHEISHLILRHNTKSMLSTAFTTGAQLVLIALLDPTGITSMGWELLGYLLSR